MARLKPTTLDPRTLSEGTIAPQVASWDEYFAVHGPEAFQLILGHMVEGLDEPDRSAVQMLMKGCTYEEAAGMLEVDLGRRVHRRTVHRWAQRGLLDVKRRLLSAPWAHVFMEGRIGLPETEVALPPMFVIAEPDPLDDEPEEWDE